MSLRNARWPFVVAVGIGLGLYASVIAFLVIS